MDKLTHAWARMHGARRTEDPGRIREAYFELLVTAGAVVLDLEQRAEPTLPVLLTASGAVE